MRSDIVNTEINIKKIETGKYPIGDWDRKKGPEVRRIIRKPGQHNISKT